MLKDDALSDCCKAPYRVKLREGDDIWPAEGSYAECSVCGKPCGLQKPPPPKTLEINVHEDIKLTDHGPGQV